MRPEIAVAFPFTAPTVVNRPGGWEDTIPSWLRELAVTQRLVLMMKDNEGLATWADVAMYLYTVNLDGPIDLEHARIYFHACLNCLKDAGKPIPEGYEDAEELSSYVNHLATNLRAKIYAKQLRHVMDAFKAWKREHKNESESVKPKDLNTLDNWIVMTKQEREPEPLVKALTEMSA